MPDWLDKLASTALKSIEEKYYSTDLRANRVDRSLKDAILKETGAAIISEIKFASPSKGIIREKSDLKSIARAMEEGGVAGISILTEPVYFGGNIEFIAEIQNHIKIPILMKDFILSLEQIDIAAQVGASAILLIQALFDRGYCQHKVQEMIDYAHSRGIEILLEAHTEEEFEAASKTKADLIGINNRNLKTLDVSLKVTEHILSKRPVRSQVIVSESGVHTLEDIRFLSSCGAQAFLIGTSIMQSSNISQKVRGLVKAI